MKLRELPLIALLEKQELEGKFQAVIDMNVLFRMQDEVPSGNNHDVALSYEAKALQEGSLADDVIFLVTNESFNEIARNDDERKRRYRLNYAHQFQITSCEVQQIEDARQSLNKHFPPSHDLSTESDIRQLTNTIAANADCFVTQDNFLLKKAEDLNAEYNIKVLSPGEFVSTIDEIIREKEYEPKRIAGTNSIKRARLQSKDLPLCYDYFRNLESAEKRTHFERLLRSFMAQPEIFDIQLFRNAEGSYLALVVYDKSDINELNIPVIRVTHSRLMNTITRYVLKEINSVAVTEKRDITRVTKNAYNIRISDALDELGFTQVGDDWIKYNLSFVGNSSELVKLLEDLKASTIGDTLFINNLIGAVSQTSENTDVLMMAEIERRLWPAKILDIGINNYIVPIRPYWAQHLFDSRLAEQTLWGAQEDIVLRHENVYYRSAFSPWAITSPARIFWYVSNDKRYSNSKQLRACSFLNEVAIGKPSELFKRFQHLGIYQWDDVFRTANNDTSNNIMALRFSNTEMLLNPVSLEPLREIMQSEDRCNLVLQSPQLISSEAFARLYKLAMFQDGGNN